MYKYATIDIETTGLDRYRDKITWVGIGFAESIDSPAKIKTFDCSSLDDEKAMFKAFEKMRAEKMKTVFQNGKFDTLFLEHHYDLKLPISEDVMLMGTAYDLAESHGLKDMAQRYLGVPDWDISKKEKLNGASPSLRPYLRKDVKYTWELFQYFYSHMDKRQIKVYKDLLRPAYLMYRDVERNGIYVDVPALKEVKKKYKDLETEYLGKLNSQYQINWNSSAQVADVLFNKESLPVIKKSQKTGAPSADAAVLKRLAAKGHELPQLILDYKAVNTLNKMFLNRWENDLGPDERIHPSFNLTNVVSGRTSSNSPNLQQCYDSQTEVLTNRGFVYFDSLRSTDKVAQWEDGDITFTPPERIIKQPYHGDMVQLTSGHIDLCLTPDHRCLIQDRKNECYSIILAENYKSDYRHLHAGIHRLKGVELSPEYITLIVATQADAEIVAKNALRFKFAKERKYTRLKDCLDALKMAYTERVDSKGRFEIITEPEALTKCYPYINDKKCFTWQLLGLSVNSKKQLLAELPYWDGLYTRAENVYTSVIKKNADIVQALYTLTDKRALLSVYSYNKEQNSKYQIAYRVYETKRNYSLTTNVAKDYVPYDGTVYCVTVPTGFIVVRRNGKTSICGNCPRNKDVRGVFKAPAGRLFFEADYSQLELRIAADYANDKTMLDIYNNGGDIHTTTAKLMTNGREPTKEERQKAKAVNFGKM